MARKTLRITLILLAGFLVFFGIVKQVKTALAAQQVNNPKVFLPVVIKGKEVVDGGNRWQPTSLIISWQWQLMPRPLIDTTVDAELYDLDLFDTDSRIIASLKAKGRKTVCYTSIGTREGWRPDADQFPGEVVGNRFVVSDLPVDEWPDERWLDIRQIDKLAPVIRARLDLCKSKGFDGIEPDNLSAWMKKYDTGFPITPEDQIKFNRWLANEAHLRGLSIGLKSDPDQSADLVNDFDFSMTEDCYKLDNYCYMVQPFVDAGKPVLNAEYTDMTNKEEFLNKICPYAKEHHYNMILKNRSLDSWRVACP